MQTFSPTHLPKELLLYKTQALHQICSNTLNQHNTTPILLKTHSSTMAVEFSLMIITTKMKSSLLIPCLELINLTLRLQNPRTLSMKNHNHLYSNQYHEEDRQQE